ncbi:MAG: hypothetical protein COA97_02015 [Flavobacteriales bacterium]|nr:MAG: hypothetical protein COA97_02015 [Flavobacteriales bacterium]
MKYIFLISISCLLTLDGFAKKEKTPKPSYEEYINQYGIDDTSIAIIELFFEKRNYSAPGKMSFLPVAAGVTAIVPPIGLGLAVITAPLFLSGLLTRHKYSHKNLLIALQNYNKSNVFSNNFKNKIAQQIKMSKTIHNQEINQEKLIALQQIKTQTN